jgi:hypothetical protein
VNICKDGILLLLYAFCIAADAVMWTVSSVTVCLYQCDDNVVSQRGRPNRQRCRSER